MCRHLSFKGSRWVIGDNLWFGFVRSSQRGYFVELMGGGGVMSRQTA
jgi:hypothetical protein